MKRVGFICKRTFNNPLHARNAYKRNALDKRGNKRLMWTTKNLRDLCVKAVLCLCVCAV